MANQIVMDHRHCSFSRCNVSRIALAVILTESGTWHRPDSIPNSYFECSHSFLEVQFNTMDIDHPTPPERDERDE